MYHKSNLYKLLEYCEQHRLGVHFSHVKNTLTIFKDARINKVIYQANYEVDLDATALRALIGLEQNYEK